MLSYPRVKIEDEYRKDPKLRKEDVATLLDWCSQQKHLPVITEFQAMSFLHSNYYDLEAAKRTIESDFDIRTRHSDVFDPILDEDVIKKTMLTTFVKVLPERTPNDDIVLITRLLDFNPSRFNVTDCLKITNALLLADLYKNGLANGLIIIYDAYGASFGHLFRMHFSVMKLYVNYYENGLPFRLKQMHYVNNSAVIKGMLNILKPVLSDRLQHMYYFHSGDHTTLYEHIPKEILPQEIYGSGKTIDELMEGHIDEFLEDRELFKWIKEQKTLIQNEERKRGWF